MRNLPLRRCGSAPSYSLRLPQPSLRFVQAPDPDSTRRQVAPADCGFIGCTRGGPFIGLHVSKVISLMLFSGVVATRQGVRAADVLTTVQKR